MTTETRPRLRMPVAVFLPVVLSVLITPEEHKRRGDAADELFQAMKRRIAEKITERS